jgi:hypothetical protein
LLAILATRYFAFGGFDLQIPWNQVCLFQLFMLLYISERGGLSAPHITYIFIEVAI